MKYKKLFRQQEELARGQSSTQLAVTSNEEFAKVRGIRARNSLALFRGQVNLVTLSI